MKNTRAWTFLLGLLPLVAWAQLDDPALDRKITFTSRASRMPILLEALSKHAGLSFKTVPAMEDDVIVVDVRDISLRDLLAKLAEQSVGEWSRSDGTWYLSKDSAKLREVARAERAKRIEAIKKSIARCAREVQEAFTADAIQKRIEEGRKLADNSDRFDIKRYHRQKALGRQVPMARALNRIFSKLDPAMLADMAPGDRLALSSHPTPMQRPLPSGVGPIIASLVAEQRSYAGVLSALPDRPGDEEMMPFNYTPKKPFKQAPARVLLILTAQDYWVTPGARLCLYDEKGKGIGEYEDSFNEFDVEDEGMKRPDPPPNLDPTPIEFTADSREYAVALQKIRERKAGDLPDIAPEWLERFARPDLHEPLSYAATDLVLQMARAKQAQVVLSLSDAYGLSFSQFPVGKKTISVGEFGFFMGAGVVDGWFVLRPPGPMREPERASRTAIARFVADIRAKGRVTLDNLAQFALAGDVRQWRLASMIAPAFTPELTLNWWDKGNIEAIRLFGTFTPQQRGTLQGGAGIPVQSLAPRQKALVHRLLFGVEANVSVTDDEGDDEVATPDVMADDEMYFHTNRGWSEEPTNALPRGIPLDAKITLTSKSGPVIFPSDSTSADRGYYIWAMDPESVAASMAYRERPDLFPWANEQPAYDLFRVADRETWTIVIDPRPGVSADYPLNDDSMQTKGRGVSFKDLPAAVREQIEKSLQKQRESFKDMKPGDFSQGGGRKRPPPVF